MELFNEVRENWWQSEGREQGRVYPLCLAGIGPYGAYLANGAEYRGRYGVSKEVLRQFHARRMELLWNAGADIQLYLRGRRPYLGGRRHPGLRQGPF